MVGLGRMGQNMVWRLAKAGHEVVVTDTDAKVIDETVARAQKLGARVITPRTDIKEGSFAVLQDPAGARIGVFQKAE